MKFSFAYLLVLALFALAVSQAALTRERRSVNFTPSWGKRSAGMDSFRYSQIAQNSPSDETSRCFSRGLYLETLVETLKAELESFGDCLGQK